MKVSESSSLRPKEDWGRFCYGYSIRFLESGSDHPAVRFIKSLLYLF